MFRYWLTRNMYGGPSVSRHFCFINIVFTLNAFHLEVDVNAYTTHLQFISNYESISNLIPMLS